MLHFNKLSYWEKETYINHTDLLIVGSGIVGLSTAIHFKERNPGKKVTVLERGYLPTGASSKNAGFACIGSPSELLADLKKSSEEHVFDTVKKRWKGLQYLREILGDKNIDFQANGSYELFHKTDHESYSECVDQLGYLNEKLAPITGIKTIFTLAEEACQQFNFNKFSHAIQHHGEGQLDTGKMLFNLVKLAQSKDVIIINGISALEIEKNTLTTNFGSINFQQLAICTNGFAQELLPLEDVRPARAQVIITKPIPNLKVKGIFHFDEGYYYFRNVGDRILFGGGRNLDLSGEETTSLENTQLITNNLKTKLRTEILPSTDFEIDCEWAGTMGVGATKSPLIKQIQSNVFCGVRLGGMGVAIGTLVGKELAELLTKSN